MRFSYSQYTFGISVPSMNVGAVYQENSGGNFAAQSYGDV
jgi:hypothetical protein